MSVDLPAFRYLKRPIGPPMLCKTLDVVPDDERMLASVKLDGWRAFASIADQMTELRSREGHAITAVPYLITALGELAGPGTILDGELVDRARPRQLRRTNTLLASQRPHVPTDANPPLTFAAFDLLFHNYTDLRDWPLHERLTRLAALVQDARERGLAALGSAPSTRPLVLAVEHRPSSAAFAEEMLATGEEGVVVKLRDSRYVHGSRTGWWRYKPQDTIDARCTAIARPRGRTTGPASSLAFELDGGATGQVSSGLSAAEREHAAAHPGEYVGRLLELAHHGIETSGALRHPVYRGVRDPADKATRDPAPSLRRRTVNEAALARANSGTSGKRRNYRAMKDPKLIESLESLRAKRGDAYERCLERGSNDPAGDLHAALKEAARRGLDV